MLLQDLDQMILVHSECKRRSNNPFCKILMIKIIWEKLQEPWRELESAHCHKKIHDGPFYLLLTIKTFSMDVVLMKIWFFPHCVSKKICRATLPLLKIFEYDRVLSSDLD